MCLVDRFNNLASVTCDGVPLGEKSMRCLAHTQLDLGRTSLTTRHPPHAGSNARVLERAERLKLDAFIFNLEDALGSTTTASDDVTAVAYLQAPSYFVQREPRSNGPRNVLRFGPIVDRVWSKN
jgi:hypothetical protein